MSRGVSTEPSPAPSSSSYDSDIGGKWLHPDQVLKLQRLKLKRKQLQARIDKTNPNSAHAEHLEQPLQSNFILGSLKRRNPFAKDAAHKRPKLEKFQECENSSDQTIFKFINKIDSNHKSDAGQLSFNRVLERSDVTEPSEQHYPEGKSWIPIDWSLKTKVRLLSSKPFVWSPKLKTGEEASGITGFVRCLDVNSETSLDTSPNARFHQCCLYWQQPCLPWLNLFPRNVSQSSCDTISTGIRESLHRAWTDGLRSLFQLLRTCQCPYFYVCADAFTVLFRAAGMCGTSEMNALVTPTTRGFRHMLKQEDIEFTVPLKTNCDSSPAHEEDDGAEEQWLESMGFDAEDIKRINYAQIKSARKVECNMDNSEQSTVFVEGTEVQAFYNFIINYKSGTNAIGPLAGVPPTLLAPVAFNGATLNSLSVRESKARLENASYFSLELNGPILPHVIHNLCTVHVSENSLTATFANFAPVLSYNKVKPTRARNEDDRNTSRNSIFGRENLSDCGLSSHVLKHFCTSNPEQIAGMECLKYNAESKSYTWW